MNLKRAPPKYDAGAGCKPSLIAIKLTTRILYKPTYPNEADIINTCFHGAGYGAKDKLKTECRSAADHIDRLMSENLSPVGFTEEQLHDHIMGVIMAEHFSLKKGIKLFGDKAEDATTEELRAIHDMGTYKPIDA